GHDDDAVIAELSGIEVFCSDTGAERRNHRLDLVAGQHLVETRLLDVQNLALDRQDCLETAVASLLRGTAGGLAFDDVQLALRGGVVLALRKHASQRASPEERSE